MSRHPLLPAPHTALRAVVVVPARDEAARIGACLLALARQQGVPGASYEVILILDGCVDETAAVVDEFKEAESAMGIHVVELSTSRGVGRARRQGMELACERLLSLGRRDGLIASTDADSIVAADWLATQLELVGAGARAACSSTAAATCG